MSKSILKPDIEYKKLGEMLLKNDVLLLYMRPTLQNKIISMLSKLLESESCIMMSTICFYTKSEIFSSLKWLLTVPCSVKTNFTLTHL